MLKTNSTQICLRNGSLEEFSKYICRKPVDRELWRRNVQDTAIFIEWRPGTSRMTELTNICTEWRPGILRIKLTEWIPRTYSRTAERKHTYIYRMTAGILKTKRHETYYRTQFIHGIKTTCCTCEFFEKLKLHSSKRLVRISAFWKTHSRKLIPN